MKKPSIIVIVSIVFLFGCQVYTSKYPIGNVEEAYVKYKLIGEWKFVRSARLSNDSKQSTYEPHKMQIIDLNDKECLIRLIPDSLESIRDVELFIGYITKIDNEEYANVRTINMEFRSEPDIEYTIHKFQLDKDTLQFLSISSKTMEQIDHSFSSIQEHRDFILKNNKLWDLETKYIKISNKRDR